VLIWCNIYSQALDYYLKTVMRVAAVQGFNELYSNIT